MGYGSGPRQFDSPWMHDDFFEWLDSDEPSFTFIYSNGNRATFFREHMVKYEIKQKEITVFTDY